MNELVFIENKINYFRKEANKVLQKVEGVAKLWQNFLKLNSSNNR